MALVESFSGIRGVFGKDLTGNIARRYAYVYHQYLTEKLQKTPQIVVGTDTRESATMLKEAIFDSLFDIIDVGVMTTPGIEFAVRELKADGGIIVTASHNEPEFNGLKFLGDDGGILQESQAIIDRYHAIENLSEEDFLNTLLYKDTEPGRVKHIMNVDIKSRYFDFLLKIIGSKAIGLIRSAGLSVVLDPVGGTAIIARDILKNLNVKVKCLNCKEGDFTREIDPSGDAIEYLTNEVGNYNFAAAFDLDGDRMAIATKEGTISGNQILALLVEDVISQKKGTIVINDATSQVVNAVAAEHKVDIKEVEVGEANVVKTMYDLNSPIGGEGSSAGAIYPPSRCRDGILSLLFILKILAENQKTLQQLVAALPIYHNIKKALPFDPSKNDEIKEKLKKHYRQHKMQETGGSTGGLKVVIDKHTYVWFRASKTEGNLFRIIVDSDDKEKAHRLMTQAVEFFQSL